MRHKAVVDKDIERERQSEMQQKSGQKEGKQFLRQAGLRHVWTLF